MPNLPSKPVKTLGLYIHIPFCKTICVYCNFLTFANKNRWIPAYIEALKKEVSLKSSTFKDYLVQTIYFGGGTPSLIDAELIEDLIRALRTNFYISKDVEINLEANPESLNQDKLEIYRKSGVTRLSLGVQSLNPKTLWKIARPHDEKTTLAALRLLHQEKWPNFGCDLIMGLPYQTLPEFQQQLETILSFNPTHLSAYFLSYDTKRIDTFIADSPGENGQIAMYEFLSKTLREAGFKHYEVSNFAKPGFQSRHNLRYWDRKEYLGLGLGAHSFIDESVNENTRNFFKYLKTPTLLEESYALDPDTARMDKIMLSLRQSKGINLKAYQKAYGIQKLKELIKSALKYTFNQLKITPNSIRATEKGFLILDRITRDLL